MGNTYFRFKQFTIHQERSAMKVCTDACIFGAWVTSQLQQATVKPAQVLDIGTGTGLLSLMLAQQTNASIDALEMDADAAEQAKDNFNASPWADRLHCFHTDARVWQATQRYDTIISNPPFFEQDLRSPDAQRNMALHDAGLLLQDLLKLSAEWLQPDGWLFVLVPLRRKAYLLETARENGWHLHALTELRQTTTHAIFRCMAAFSKQAVTETQYRLLTISEGRSYTAEIHRLLQPYYFKL